MERVKRFVVAAVVAVFGFVFVHGTAYAATPMGEYTPTTGGSTEVSYEFLTGNSWTELDSTIQTALINSSVSGDNAKFAYFRNSVHGSQGSYSSTLDGIAFVNAADDARDNIRTLRIAAAAGAGAGATGSVQTPTETGGSGVLDTNYLQVYAGFSTQEMKFNGETYKNYADAGGVADHWVDGAMLSITDELRNVVNTYSSNGTTMFFVNNFSNGRYTGRVIYIPSGLTYEYVYTTEYRGATQIRVPTSIKIKNNTGSTKSIVLQGIALPNVEQSSTNYRCYWLGTYTKDGNPTTTNVNNGSSVEYSTRYCYVLIQNGQIQEGGASGSSGGTAGNTYVNNENTTNIGVNGTINNVTYDTTTNNITSMDVDLSPITQRLDSLNAMVGSIGKSLDREMDELQSQLATAFSTLWNAMDNQVQAIKTWLQVIEQDLKQVIYELQHLEISGGGGGGGGSGSDDGESILDALIALLLDVLNLLLGDISGTASDVLEQLTELTDRFPFSVPWDVIAIMQLIRAEPVTPSITWALPMPGGSTETMNVDLHDWDGVMSYVRVGETLLFALGLVMQTARMTGEDTNVGG